MLEDALEGVPDGWSDTSLLYYNPAHANDDIERYQALGAAHLACGARRAAPQRVVWRDVNPVGELDLTHHPSYVELRLNGDRAAPGADAALYALEQLVVVDEALGFGFHPI